MYKRQDIKITDKHVDIGKNYDIPRTNSFPENDYQLTDALREVRERVADSLAKDFSDDKETQEQFKEMYSSLHGSWSVRQGDPHERDSLCLLYTSITENLDDSLLGDNVIASSTDDASLIVDTAESSESTEESTESEDVTVEETGETDGDASDDTDTTDIENCLLYTSRCV